MKRVFKFGGALMKEAEGIQRVAQLISNYKNDQLVVVVSAFGKTTNALEQLLKFHLEKNLKEKSAAFKKLKTEHFNLTLQLFKDNKHPVFNLLENQFHLLETDLKKNLEDKYEAYDLIVGYGELFSSLIVHYYLLEKNLPSHLVDARTIIHTNSNFTDAAVNWKNTEKKINDRLMLILKNNEIVLTQGFIGADDNCNTTTLGREGSDFTASIIANLIDAEEVSIWKDVPGLMNADPKRFEKTEKLEHISYQEAIELVYYGASVIHPKTIQPLQRKDIPLYIRSFYNPDSSPSVISKETSMDDKIPKIIVKDKQVLLSICKLDATFINTENLVHIFGLLGENKIHFNLMQHSATKFLICFDENPYKLESLLSTLNQYFQTKHETGLTLLTIRHYNGELVNELTIGKKILLEQESRSTIQLLTS